MNRASPTVAAVILDILAEKGVKKAFGIPGVHNLGFWNALNENRPEIVSVRHEQTCVYAADALARATGTLSVALTTTGPGAANTLGAFGEASISGSKVLVISSEAPIKDRRDGGARGILHEMNDQSSLFSPLAKRVQIEERDIVLSKSTTNADEAIATIVDYLEIIEAAPAGTGYIGIPSDVLNQVFTDQIPSVSLFVQKYLKGIAEEDLDLSELIATLANKKRIGIWAGGGAVDVSNEIAKISDHLSAPIFTSFAGRGVGVESRNYVDLPIHEPEVEEMLTQCDALVVFGSQLDGMNTKNWNLNFPQTICIIDANPIKASRNVKAQIIVKSANLAAVIEKLHTLKAQPNWLDVKAICAKARERITTSNKGIAGMSLVTAIEKAWPSENFIVCDMAISGYWTGVYLRANRVRQIAYPVGWGTLGYGLPASIGTAVIGLPTLVVCGDGGIAFGLGELATVAQEKLPLTILLHDDGGYGMLRFDQLVMNHPVRGVNLFNPDWQQLASAFNLDFTTTNLSGLENALTERQTKNRPGIILLRDEIYPPRSTSPRWQEKGID